MSFKFGDIQPLDILKLFGDATSHYSFWKAYKISETQRFFPYDWFHHTVKMQKTELPPYDAFYSKHRSCNPIKT